ncbi:MAG: hypothetical protein IPJ19_11885 [Planctomycetes bacterium]|nr:hypothetical protein [Planctomycetota bacterium]
MFQRHGEPGLDELLRKYVGPALVGFFVFVLPAIRAAMAGKKQRDELRQRKLGRSGAPEPEEEPQPGVDAWEELMRGRREAARAAPPPLPTVSRIPAPEPQRPALVELPTSTLPSASEEETEEGLEDEETLAEQVLADRARERERLRDPAVAAFSAVPVVQRNPVVGPAAAAEWLFPGDEKGDRSAALRRAIVLREVLGPPVALRGELPA